MSSTLWGGGAHSPRHLQPTWAVSGMGKGSLHCRQLGLAPTVMAVLSPLRPHVGSTQRMQEGVRGEETPAKMVCIAPLLLLVAKMGVVVMFSSTEYHYSWHPIPVTW